LKIKINGNFLTLVEQKPSIQKPAKIRQKTKECKKDLARRAQDVLLGKQPHGLSLLQGLRKARNHQFAQKQGCGEPQTLQTSQNESCGKPTTPKPHRIQFFTEFKNFATAEGSKRLKKLNGKYAPYVSLNSATKPLRT
jgi:hypothetical protein